MKPSNKTLVVLLLAVAATSPWLFSRDRPALLENFEFQGERFSLEAVFSPAGADLLLQGRDRARLSAGMEGENPLLGVRFGKDNFYVFWLNDRDRSRRLAYYDHRRRRSQMLPLQGFTAISFPEVIERAGRPYALLFLADFSGNDDLFMYQLGPGTLVRLTDTPYCEKSFTWREVPAGLEFETVQLRGRSRYRFDAGRRLSTLLEEEKRALPKRKDASAPGQEYYNTYVGFGDSITWGQIEGVQRTDLCFLTQMKETYLALDYGPSDYVNLGVPGEQTYQSALRVDGDLDANPALYFLLMLGVNDVWRLNFSLASSLESLEYIIDAALERDMRVIVSTLTPRKDVFSGYQYYWNNLKALSAGILDLAAKKGTASIDTLNAFMGTDPPDGWKDLLETPGTVIIDGEEIEIKGNHPNGAGHALIASLYADALVKFPPFPPQNIRIVDPASSLKRTAFWDPSNESDFDHFQIEFGFQPGDLPYSASTANSFFTFHLFPFLPALDFRVQTVDRSGNVSGYIQPGASAKRAPRAKIVD